MYCPCCTPFTLDKNPLNPVWIGTISLMHQMTLQWSRMYFSSSCDQLRWKKKKKKKKHLVVRWDAVTDIEAKDTGLFILSHRSTQTSLSLLFERFMKMICFLLCNDLSVFFLSFIFLISGNLQIIPHQYVLRLLTIAFVCTPLTDRCLRVWPRLIHYAGVSGRCLWEELLSSLSPCSKLNWYILLLKYFL